MNYQSATANVDLVSRGSNGSNDESNILARSIVAGSKHVRRNVPLAQSVDQAAGKRKANKRRGNERPNVQVNVSGGANIHSMAITFTTQ